MKSHISVEFIICMMKMSILIRRVMDFRSSLTHKNSKLFQIGSLITKVSCILRTQGFIFLSQSQCCLCVNWQLWQWSIFRFRFTLKVKFRFLMDCRLAWTVGLVSPGVGYRPVTPRSTLPALSDTRDNLFKSLRFN